MYRADLPLRGFDNECRAQITENLTKREITVGRDEAKREIQETPPALSLPMACSAFFMMVLTDILCLCLGFICGSPCSVHHEHTQAHSLPFA